MKIRSLKLSRLLWLSIAAALLAPARFAAADPAETYDLTPGPSSDQSQHVTVELEFGGDLVAKNYLPAATSAADKDDTIRLPMTVRAELEYDERTRSADQSVRHYAKAEATIESGAGVKLPRLNRENRLIVADTNEESRTTLRSSGGLLTRDELDLIDIAGDARALERLLPEKPIEEGGSWGVDSEAMAALLGLDSVAVCEVTCVLDSGNDRYVRFQLAGSVQGAVDSAATEFDVRAIGLFHREKRQVIQLNLAMKEKRAVGDARPGVEGTAKLNIKRVPTATPTELSDAALGKLGEPTEQVQLVLNGGRQGFRATHDRQWFVAAEGSESVTLRRVSESGLISQTTLRKLPPKASERRPTLETFEKEIRFSLGQSFGQLVSSEQWTNQAGCYCMGLVVRGEAEGAAVEWRYQMVMPGENPSEGADHMISIATTVEQSLAERAGKSDRELADSLELVKPTNEASSVAWRQPTYKSTTSKRASRTAKKSSRRSTGVRRRR